MTSTGDGCTGGTFKRGVSDAFIEALRQLAKQESWWREVLADPDLIIAGRDEYLNVYWQGQSLFRVLYNSNAVQARTHPKYLLDPALEKLVPFDGTRFALLPSMSALVDTWKAGVTLGKMKKAAGAYANGEKRGVHATVRNNSTVLDVEIALWLPSPKPGEKELPRIDIASLERNGKAIRLVFWEAKLFNNKDLRAEGTSKPCVLKQIEGYRDILQQQRSAVLDSYRRVAKNLFDIASMRPGVPDLDDLVRQVVDNPQLLTMAEPPDVGLIIFKYDKDQWNGPTWEPYRTKLKGVLPKHRLRNAGKPEDVWLPSYPGETAAERTLRAKLQALANFVPVFTASGFQFGTWHSSPPDASGTITLPFCFLGHDADEFVEMAYRLKWVRPSTFQWPDWMNRPEAKALMDSPDRIAAATPDQLEKLLTVHIRGDRFNEGLLLSVFESGVLTAIVRRAEALLRLPPPRELASPAKG